ncbi:MAG: metallophosphoesterase [Candidatus Margulisiibacteriota bacterium]
MKNRIIHLSDLHIGYRSCGAKAEKIVATIIKEEDPAGCVIVITGDLVEQGKRDINLKAAFYLVSKLKNQGFKVLICPGNHDYGTGFVNSRRYAQNFRQMFLPDVKEFPQVEIINGVAFIGLDSNEDELHWYDRFFADGEIGAGQLVKLDKILTDPEIMNKTKVVYLHHHPFPYFPFHNLKDSRKLKKVVENRIDVLLYGHLHFGRSYNNAWGIPVVLDGGSSTGKRAASMLGIHIKHRVIDLADLSFVEKNYLAG